VSTAVAALTSGAAAPQSRARGAGAPPTADASFAGPQPGAYTSPGAARTRTAQAAEGMTAGVWLVVTGGFLIAALSFVLWYGYKNTGDTSRYWLREFTVNPWVNLWPGRFFAWQWWRSWQGWAQQLLYIGIKAGPVLCVVAPIQALRRGLAEAPVNGLVLRAFGIVMAACAASNLVFGACSPAMPTVTRTSTSPPLRP
jgi:hypothetical protein